MTTKKTTVPTWNELTEMIKNDIVKVSNIKENYLEHYNNYYRDSIGNTPIYDKVDEIENNYSFSYRGYTGY